jgi:uncharacterized protein (DUF2147 family)
MFLSMKKFFAFLFLLLFFAGTQAQKQAEPLLGRWQNDTKDIIIEFYKTKDNLWNAKIVWLKDNDDHNGEPKRDVYNSDPKLRTRKIIGIDLLYGLKTKSSNDKWIGGSIYNYENGQSYNAIIFLEDENTILIKGYWWMFRFLGGTKAWTKVKAK